MLKKTNLGDFTGGPVVKTCHFHHRVDVGLIPGLELRFPHAARCGQNVKKKKKKKLEDSYPDFKTYYEVIVIRHCGTRKRTDIKMNGID